MKRYFLLAGAFLALMGLQDLVSESLTLEQMLPEEDTLENWNLEFGIEHYTPDNLYEYINGEAELYNDYGFVEMITAYYTQSDGGDAAIAVDIYDMGSPLSAFGIYSSYRRPGLEFQDIGTETIVSGANIRFYKNQYFIQVNGNSMEPEIAAAAKGMAESVAGNIPDADQPVELSMLPQQNRVEHSLTYVTTGFLGQSAFGKSLEAEYNISGESCKGFLVMFDSNSAAKKALQDFEDMLAQSGTIHESSESGKLIAEERFQGNITAAVHGSDIAGVYDYEAQDTAESLLTLISQK
ncbi:MAG: hypothetical protein GF372_03495 [Candidatus Marinimicrobia bacterium]|nr:hypothetical protein [Candidatus Neomarinimicrobiota bacterium]